MWYMAGWFDTAALATSKDGIAWQRPDFGEPNGRPPLELPACSYVAVTTHGPEIETGIPSAVEDTSFHVVVGRY